MPIQVRVESLMVNLFANPINFPFSSDWPASGNGNDPTEGLSTGTGSGQNETRVGPTYVCRSQSQSILTQLSVALVMRQRFECCEVNLRIGVCLSPVTHSIPVRLKHLRQH